jgi:hypothetical protein
MGRQGSVERYRGVAEMSDDLVKRLRRADTCIFPTERDLCHCGEAADRILELEAALRDLSEGWECCPVSQAMRRVARKALEGKDE